MKSVDEARRLLNGAIDAYVASVNERNFFLRALKNGGLERAERLKTDLARVQANNAHELVIQVGKPEYITGNELIYMLADAVLSIYEINKDQINAEKPKARRELLEIQSSVYLRHNNGSFIEPNSDEVEKRAKMNLFLRRVQEARLELSPVLSAGSVELTPSSSSCSVAS